MTLGLRIHTLRTQLKLTQSELAKDLCSPSFISQIEADKAIPSEPLLMELSARLQVPIESLLKEIETRLTLKVLIKPVDHLLEKGNDLQALQLFGQTVPDLPEEQIQWLLLLGDYAIRLGLTQNAFEAYHLIELLLPADRESRAHLYMRLWPRLAVASLLLHRYELGQMWIDRFVRLFTRSAAGNRDTSGESAHVSGEVAVADGDGENGHFSGKISLASVELALSSAGKAALAYIEREDAKCAAYLQDALDQLPKGTAHSDRAAVYTMQSVLEHRRGNLEEALQAAEIAVTLWKTEKRWHEEMQTRLLLSSLLLDKGARAEAFSWLNALVEELAAISDAEDDRLDLLGIETRLLLTEAVYAEDPQAAVEHLQEAGTWLTAERAGWHPPDLAIHSVSEERFLYGIKAGFNQNKDDQKKSGQNQVHSSSRRSTASYGIDMLLPLYLKQEQDLRDLWNQKIKQFPASVESPGNA